MNCPNSIQIDSNVKTTSNEIYIPAQTLSIGIYELKLTVSMNMLPNLQTSKSAYVRITASGITANPVPLGTSMITSGSKQNLELNPGLYSVDLDGYEFRADVKLIMNFIFGWLIRFLSRIGTINTIVEFMDFQIFQISKAHYYQLMTLESILAIHHVYQIDQVIIVDGLISLTCLVIKVVDQQHGNTMAFSLHQNLH